MMAYTEIPRRDASAVIRGFVFQVNLTILRWIELPSNSRLELERGEDIDTVQDGSMDGAEVEKRLLEQLKVRDTRALTLKSPEALQSLANYCRHRQNNSEIDLQFRYITTAEISVELGWSRAEGAVDTWMALRRGAFGESERSDAVAAIQEFLLACDKPGKTSAESWMALRSCLGWDVDTLLTQMIMPFEWGAGFGSYKKIEDEVVAALSSDSYATYGTPDLLYEHLFAFVFRLLCQQGKKELTRQRLEEELARPSIGPAERGILRLLRDALGLMREEISAVKTTVDQQVEALGVLTAKVGELGQSLGIEPQFGLRNVSFSTEPPDLLPNCAPRTSAVDEILAGLTEKGIIALFGEPGSGKTQLLRLSTVKLPLRQFWLTILRDAPEAQASSMVEAFLRSIAGTSERLSFHQTCVAAAQRLGASLVILDDLPRIIPGGQFARQIETFAKALRAAGGQLLLASYFPLPATLASSLGTARYDVRRFETNDVLELLVANDAPLQMCTEKMANLLVTVAEGLPTLVMAAVRYLREQNWSFTHAELEALFKGEFAAEHRHDAASLLQIIVPDDQERELLIRMSLAIGDFSAEDIAKVACIPKSIRLPGEKIARATGVWLQRTSEGRYTRSPLITAAMGEALDPKVRRAVYFVLAMQILDRKSLSPIEIFTCFNHLLMAETVVFAAMVVLQALSCYLEMEEAIEDDFGLSRMWASVTFDDELPIDLLLYLKGMQIAVLAKQGREFSTSIAQLDQMIANAPKGSWGAAMAAAVLAVHLVWVMPALANKYVLEALRRVPTVRLPDGSAFPTSEYPLEMVLLMSSYTGKSDEDADSWLATIVKLTAEQIATLQSSDLMEDNVTILCDGFWRREFAKSVVERDWDRLADKLKQIEATGTQAGFPLLAAAAIRTQILVLAEWQLRLEDAVALSESALARFDRDDSRFLVLEVTGRHISYAGQSERAIPWLERALACDAYRYSLWRRDVLITLAELNGATAPQTAVDLTAQAISVADGPQGYEQGIGEALAEHGIALWKAGDRRSAFTTFEKAVDRYLTAPSDSELWKGSFFRLFASLVYFSDVMKWGQPREGHQEPLQGAFLASQELHLSYRGEQRSYICSRLATYAEGLDEIVRAAHWIARAVGYAREYPAAWADIRFSCVLALPSALVANDFNRAAETAALVSKTELDQVPAQAEPIVAALATAPTANAGEMEGVVAAATPEIHNKGFLIHPFVPIAVRLATLSVSSATPEQIAGYLAQIDNHVPVDHAPLGFTADLRRGLIDREDWHSLHREGFEAVSGNELVHGYVLCIGAMLNAPVPAALYLQTMLAQHLEGFAASAPSVYRHVIAPMFRAYWERVIDTSVVLFHTSLYYTRRQLELADGSPTGTRRFLSAMCTCLRAKMPEETMAWLNS